MEFFVNKESIVRKIWGKSDTILFIFAGAAAEFALNKAVDWLYFTGRLPADPIGRLFSTVTYARLIIFSEKEEANKAIDKITSIHAAVEKNRGRCGDADTTERAVGAGGDGGALLGWRFLSSQTHTVAPGRLGVVHGQVGALHQFVDGMQVALE